MFTWTVYIQDLTADTKKAQNCRVTTHPGLNSSKYEEMGQWDSRSHGEENSQKQYSFVILNQNGKLPQRKALGTMRNRNGIFHTHSVVSALLSHVFLNRIFALRVCSSVAKHLSTIFTEQPVSSQSDHMTLSSEGN